MNDTTTDPTNDPQADEHRAKVDALLGVAPEGKATDGSEPQEANDTDAPTVRAPLTAGSIPLVAVESSQIAAIGYDEATCTLAVRFNGKGGKPGSLYHYRGVSLTDWRALQDAESKGSYFIRNIKPYPDRYPYKRLDEPTEEAGVE